MLAQPVLKFLVFTAEEFQSFGHNVGWSRVEELGVVVQIAFDFFLQANLNVCGFRLFQWWFHEWHWVVSFQLTRRGAASIGSCMCPCMWWKKRLAQNACQGGSDPTNFWAAESRTRSEERRGGKEWRSRGSPDHLKKKKRRRHNKPDGRLHRMSAGCHAKFRCTT